MGHTFQRVFGFFVDPFINRESTTGLKRAFLEVYGAVLGILLLAGLFLFFGLLNSMCSIPENCVEHHLGGGAATWSASEHGFAEGWVRLLGGS
jgi:hypothetical protein